jgi:hypothetical protein
MRRILQYGTSIHFNQVKTLRNCNKGTYVSNYNETSENNVERCGMVRDQWRVVVNAVMNLAIHKSWEYD